MRTRNMTGRDNAETAQLLASLKSHICSKMNAKCSIVINSEVLINLTI